MPDLPPLVLLPVGSIEAHGPHLPPETDTILAHELARTVARRYSQRRGGMATVAPPVTEAVSGFASGFPGTRSASPEAAREALRKAVREARDIAPGTLVLINLHFDPGHLEVVRGVAREEQVLFPDFTRRAHAQRIGGEFATGSCHGGEFETSLLLAAEPQMVSGDYRQLVARWVDLPRAIQEGKRSFQELGMSAAYCGDPARATAEEGRRLYELLADMVLEEFAAAAHH